MKEKLFISYASENNDKVEIIIDELKDHPIFESIVVAKKREPNKSLVKKVTEGIDSAYRIIAILSLQSYREQWINQEIGYASAKGIPIVPIVAKSILNDLKGFIHKQNDCPYLYPSRAGLFIRDENAAFIEQFRQLIKDLEEEYKQVQKKEKQEIIKEVNRSLLPPSQQNFITSFRKSIGTIARTGEVCPERGIWKTPNQPTTKLEFAEGLKMPAIQGKPVVWRLVSYT